MLEIYPWISYLSDFTTPGFSVRRCYAKWAMAQLLRRYQLTPKAASSRRAVFTQLATRTFLYRASGAGMTFGSTPAGIAVIVGLPS